MSALRSYFFDIFGNPRRPAMSSLTKILPRLFFFPRPLLLPLLSFPFFRRPRVPLVSFRSIFRSPASLRRRGKSTPTCRRTASRRRPILDASIGQGRREETPPLEAFCFSFQRSGERLSRPRHLRPSTNVPSEWNATKPAPILRHLPTDSPYRKTGRSVPGK